MAEAAAHSQLPCSELIVRSHYPSRVNCTYSSTTVQRILRYTVAIRVGRRARQAVQIVVWFIPIHRNQCVNGLPIIGGHRA